ncbi:hypothetical protein M1P56_33420 [Streptomyces sp. HU2014]|uniref:Uncharacterized protein n=2 Tax=Streptomyces albireticuli TaxID=1940 RepID=A0A1Z2L3V3_9ACTN|nr:hypothetical protein [Streptomyces sp. HU2014]ARZ68969.1 hypothetical protein SMD11_3333 [Streptomyces albireticuli]UQI48867.1 hypothetical protein M1P56_33420 [Streptomyces sp. HU2014]
MVVLDLWEGPRTDPAGRARRRESVVRALYAAWLAPLGFTAEWPEAADGPGAPGVLLRHHRPVVIHEAARALARCARWEPVPLGALWWEPGAEDVGFADLWDMVAALRDAVYARSGWGAPADRDTVPFREDPG